MRRGGGGGGGGGGGEVEVRWRREKVGRRGRRWWREGR
jgi:hypothetical protein